MAHLDDIVARTERVDSPPQMVLAFNASRVNFHALNSKEALVSGTVAPDLVGASRVYAFIGHSLRT